MNKKNLKYVMIIVLIVLVAIVYFFILDKRQTKIDKVQTPVAELGSPKYNNLQYGFSFSLPTSWIGYTVIDKTWNGSTLDTKASKSLTGPEIILRHPLWTKDVPRQDIPIMIFTLAEWALVSQEKISLGAAPIPPSELARNSKYVFALPARYNFAYQPGFEEVEKIIQDKSLKAF